MTHLRSTDYNVMRCSHASAKSFIERHHYARGASNTSVYAFGLFGADGHILGAALWLPPTRRCAETVSRESWRTVLSLSRLAVHPSVPTNGASFLIGRCIREIRRDGKWSHLVTFADESQSHTGAIYRATNWQHVGRTKPEARWVDVGGKQVSRLATKSRKTAEMLSLGHRMVGRFAKQKFVVGLR